MAGQSVNAVWKFGGPDDPVWVYVTKCADGFKSWSGGCGIGSPQQTLNDAIRFCLGWATARLEHNKAELNKAVGAIVEWQERTELALAKASAE